MANIPNSSRYRTAGRRNTAQGTAPGRPSWSVDHTSVIAGGIHRDDTGNNRPRSAGFNWFWFVAFLALLIAFPVPTLAVLALLAFATWFLASK